MNTKLFALILTIGLAGIPFINTYAADKDVVGEKAKQKSFIHGT